MIPSSISQPTLPSGMGSVVLARNGMVENTRGAIYNSASQASTMVDFSINQSTDLPGNGFQLANNAGGQMATVTSKGLLQEEINSEMKGSRGFAPSYDIFSELQQHKSQDWGLPNVGLTFDASQHSNMRGGLDVSSLVLVQQNNVQNRITPFGKAIFSATEESGRGNGLNIGQQLDTLLAGNSLRVKAESLPEASCQNTVFHEQYSQEDLMSALLKQVSFLAFNPLL